MEKDEQLRFDDYVLDLRSGKLLRHDWPVKIQPQPLRVLSALLEHSGEIVSRETLREQVWGNATFVEFDQGLNYSIRQIRLALRDNAAKPRYIETLPKLGYRFIAPIERTGSKPEANFVVPTELGTPNPAITALPAAEAHGMNRRNLLAIAGAGGLISAFFAYRFRDRQDFARPVRVVVELPDGAAAADPVVSPDGRAIVISLRTAVGNQLFLRPLDANHLTPIEGTTGAAYPFWSADSRYIGFGANGALFTVPAKGGKPKALCPARDFRGASWGRKGVIIFSAALTNGPRQRIFSVPENGGAARAVTHLDEAARENSHRYPAFLPDSNQFLYFSRSERARTSGIYLESLDGRRARTRLTEANGQFAVSFEKNRRSGYLLTQEDSKLVAQRLNSETGDLSRRVQVVLEESGSVSVSDSGILAIRTEAQQKYRLIWRDLTGREIGSLGKPDDYWRVDLSPNEELVATIRHNELNGQFVVWISSVRGGLLEQFSSSVHASGCFFSRDGSSIYYSDFQERRIFNRSIASRGQDNNFARSLLENVIVDDITKDGRYAAARIIADNSHSQIAWARFSDDLRSELSWHSIGATGNWDNHPSFSPDGRWLLFGSREGDLPEVYLTDFPACSARHRISTNGGSTPRWRQDGKELFYLTLDGNLMSVSVSGGANCDLGKPRALFPANPRTLSAGPVYDVSRDGRRFVVIDGGSQRQESTVEVVLNWTALLGS